MRSRHTRRVERTSNRPLRFAAAEDAARLAEVMSFALAACVVAERSAAVAGRATAPGWRPLTDDVPESAVVGDTPPPRPFGALLLARLADDAGLGRLGQEPAALRALATYFGDGPSELRAIACEAERRIGLPLDRGPALSALAPPPTEEVKADPAEAAQSQAASAEPEHTPPPAIGGEDAGWEWINWVRTGLRDGSVPVNAADGWLHHIAGEAYVVSPACFEAFAAGRGIAPATVRNRVVRLGRHRQRASPSGSANVFRAVLADGSRVKGMVFPGELVWDDDPPPRANARLVGKGRQQPSTVHSIGLTPVGLLPSEVGTASSRCETHRDAGCPVARLSETARRVLPVSREQPGRLCRIDDRASHAEALRPAWTGGRPP